MSEWGNTFEELVLGSEDTQQGARGCVERAMRSAIESDSRLKVEIRVKHMGATGSETAHNYVIDPTETGSDQVLSDMISRLQDHPGNDFSGEIRIAFTKPGGQDRWGTWSRHVNAGAGRSHAGLGMGFGGGGSFGGGSGGGFTSAERAAPAMPRSLPIPGDGDLDLGSDDGSGEDGGGGGGGDLFGGDANSAQVFRHRGGPPMPITHTPSSVVSEEQMRRWLETTMAFQFRSNAQMMTMFDRAIRMFEAYTLRFGMMDAPAMKAITDIPANSNGKEAAGPLGLLPMLVNAAAALAGSDTPAKAVENAAAMAQGQEPPSGAARELAIRGASRLVNGIRKKPPAEPAAGFEDLGGGGGGPDEDGGGGGETFDVERYGSRHASFDEHEDGPEPRRGGGSLFGGGDEAGGGADLEDPLEGAMPGGGMPGPENMSSEEMKEYVLKWLKADPSRKQEVMAMVPSLMKEMS